MPEMLDTPQGRRLAYHRTPGEGPGVVFLTGLRSDMTGDKATRLQAFAQARGRAFLRLDYSGHGASGGRFEDGTIGAWAEDARAALDALTEGPQVLVGSSMGGWIALLLARAIPERVHGLVLIAPAPDFTEDGYWASFTKARRAEIMERGFVAVPSDYGDPLIVTRGLVEDGRARLVLREPLRLPMPVRLLQGTRDTAVPVAAAVRLLEHADGPDIRLTLVRGADHRFSDAACLALIERALEEVW